MADSETEKLVVELAEYVRSRFFGKYKGIVSNVGDPEKMGRIKANVPEVYGTEESPWALPSLPFAGDNYGFVLLPEVGNGIWMEFEAGDVSRPIWTGCWWANGELPAPGGEKVRTLVTPAGHKIVFDDDNNEITLEHSGGASVKMTDSDITLKMSSGEIVVSGSGVSINNGALEVK